MRNPVASMAGECTQDRLVRGRYYHHGRRYSVCSDPASEQETAKRLPDQHDRSCSDHARGRLDFCKSGEFCLDHSYGDRIPYYDQRDHQSSGDIYSVQGTLQKMVRVVLRQAQLQTLALLEM